MCLKPSSQKSANQDKAKVQIKIREKCKSRNGKSANQEKAKVQIKIRQKCKSR